MSAVRFHLQAGVCEAVLAFNLLPAAYAHRSWFGDEAYGARLCGLRSPSALRAASRWLIERHGLAGCHDFEFAQAEKRVFLHPPGVLWRLAALLGLLRHRAEVRRRVADGLLPGLMAELGGPAVRQVVAVLPDAGFLPPPPEPLGSVSGPMLLPRLAGDGAPCLMALLEPGWRAVQARARLKFPRTLALDGEPLGADARREALAYLQSHLLKEGPLWP